MEVARTSTLASTSHDASNQNLLPYLNESKLDWLQLLLDSSSTDEKKLVSDILVSYNAAVLAEELTVKKMPKILDCLVLFEINKNSTEVKLFNFNSLENPLSVKSSSGQSWVRIYYDLFISYLYFLYVYLNSNLNRPAAVDRH